MRWGIIGTGFIATQFANDVKQLKDTEIGAIYSRTAEKARKFAADHGIKKAYDALDELLGDPTIDNVYIGVPNHLHMDYVMRCVRAKKNVLCEKPMGINRKQTQQMLDAAQHNNVLLMEGMWTRFFPLMKTLRAFLQDGTFGTTRAADISLGYNSILAGEGETWRFDPKNGFGALMDMGVYGVHFALDLCGDEVVPSIMGAAQVSGGLDYNNSIILKFDETLVSIRSSISNDTDLTAKIYTDKGELTIAAPWWYPTEMTFTRFGGERQTYAFPREADGLQFEVQDFEACAMSGSAECALSSHANSLRAMDIMDELRRIWGVHYPQDDQ